METLKITLKEVIQLIGIVISLTGTYFALKNEIQNAQVKTEAAIKELDLIRSNDNKITDMQLKALQLQVTRLQDEFEYIQQTKKK